MALKRTRQVEDEQWTYTLMATTNDSTPRWIHIDNHVTNDRSALVPVEGLEKLLPFYQIVNLDCF